MLTLHFDQWHKAHPWGVSNSVGLGNATTQPVPISLTCCSLLSKLTILSALVTSPTMTRLEEDVRFPPPQETDRRRTRLESSHLVTWRRLFSFLCSPHVVPPPLPALNELRSAYFMRSSSLSLTGMIKVSLTLISPLRPQLLPHSGRGEMAEARRSPGRRVALNVSRTHNWASFPFNTRNHVDDPDLRRQLVAFWPKSLQSERWPSLKWLSFQSTWWNRHGRHWTQGPGSRW